jgi:hypothetical protein
LLQPVEEEEEEEELVAEADVDVAAGSVRALEHAGSAPRFMRAPAAASTTSRQLWSSRITNTSSAFVKHM